MKDLLITTRNTIIRWLYKGVLKRLFFLIDAEHTHDMALSAGEFLGRYSFTKALTRFFFSYSNPILNQQILGINFRNPIGLAAGFDKNGRITDILPEVGFGFEELGSVTGEPCVGNPKPRLWRLIKSKGLRVHFGLVSDGAERVAERLHEKSFKIPIGISVAKTNNEDTVHFQAGIDDYLKAYKAFATIGDFYTINISCPNTFGGEPFTDPQKLDLLLTEIDQVPATKPIFLKIPPDLSLTTLDEIIAVCEKHHISGFVCTNLTKKNDPARIHDKLEGAGGISGKVVEELADNVIKYVYKKTQGKYLIIGVGGVFSAHDAYKKIRLGASLVQLITGMIFEGPQLISEINQGLSALLKRDNFKSVSEAIGVDNR